jgi:alpha-galactosidase
MKIFGRTMTCGNRSLQSREMRIEYAVEKCPGGIKVTGKARGRIGRIEVFRGPAPREFLLNNWQSWGPLQKMRLGEKLRGIEDVMARYSPFVFSPVPEVFRKSPVSDYFIAWPGFLAGFLGSRVAHPYFVIEGDEAAGYLEYFDTAFDEPVPLEPLLLLGNSPEKSGQPEPADELPEPRVEDRLEHYAAFAAAENRVSVPARNPVGWSSWYHYFANLRCEDIEKNLRLARAGFPFDVFQIDDGYERDIGDWLVAKEDLYGLPELAELIARYGFAPGIWTAPFSAAETSRLFREHADWMVREDGRPKTAYRNWGKSIYALDCSRPDVLEWLGGTFSGLRKMGFTYFKVDFLFAAAIPGERAGQGTPIQAYRNGMKAIRAAIGDGFVLGCGAPLLPSAGFVEGMRVGEDTAPFWDPKRGAFEGPNAYYALKNPILRSFLHRRLWLNDPDCLLLRSRDISLTANEKELYALTAGALDNMIIDSDDLALVDEWGRGLLRKAIALRGGKVRVRGLMGDDLYLIESREGPAGEIRMIVNLSDRSKNHDSVEVPPRSARRLKGPGHDGRGPSHG